MGGCGSTLGTLMGGCGEVSLMGVVVEGFKGYVFGCDVTGGCY